MSYNRNLDKHRESVERAREGGRAYRRSVFWTWVFGVGWCAVIGFGLWLVLMPGAG